MSDTDSYFQYPIGLLAYGPSVEARLKAIIAWSCWDRGIAIHERISPAQAIKTLKAESFTKPQGSNPQMEDHRFLLLGMRGLKISGGNMHSMIESSCAASEFVLEWGRRFGSLPTTRTPTKLIFEVMNKAGMDYRHLSAVAAIYSVIGRKRYPVRITREMIRARMLGYSRPSHMQEWLPERADKAEPLTEKQLRNLLDDLESRRYFARCHPSPRMTYFAVGIDGGEMREKILFWKTHRSTMLEARRAADAELRDKIRGAEKKGHLNSEGHLNTQGYLNTERPSLETGAKQGPPEGHERATEGPPEGHLNKSSVQKLTNKSFSIQAYQQGAVALVCSDSKNQKGIASKPESLPKPREAVPESEPKSEPPASHPPQMTNPAPTGKPTSPTVAKFHRPALATVESFFSSLLKSGAAHAGAWFAQFESDPRWDFEDWKKQAARWLFTHVNETKRATATQISTPAERSEPLENP